MRFWVNKLRTLLSLTRGQGVQLKGHLIIGEKPTLSFFFFKFRFKKILSEILVLLSLPVNEEPEEQRPCVLHYD